MRCVKRSEKFMKVGVIGTGVMGQNHARIYSELKGVDELYVFDINTKAAEQVAHKNYAQVAPTLENLLDNVDAVSCCVPTPHHFELGKTIVERGIHLLMEKPICGNVKEGKKLVEIVPKGIVFGVGHIERFNPIVEEISRIIKNPLYVEFKRHNPDSSRVIGSSVVEDLMIHDLDIALHKLFKGQHYSVQSSLTDKIATGLLNFNSTIAYFSASMKASKKTRSLYIEQEESTIVGDFMTQEVYVYWKPENYHVEDERYVQENIIEKILVNKTEPLKKELSEFLESIKKSSEFPVTPQQALMNLELCEHILKGKSKQKFFEYH